MAHTQNDNFMLENVLFGAVKLIKNSFFDKYKYSGNSIGLNAREGFLLSVGRGFGSGSAHADNKKGTLILCEGPVQGLDDTALPAEKEDAVNLVNNRTNFV